MRERQRVPQRLLKTKKMAQCYKCKTKLVGKEANEYYEMECNQEQDFEQHSDADTGL